MMMRKLCLVAALTAAMTGFSAANAAAQLKDGTCTGEGQGRNGAIVVELTAAGGKITAVKVVKHSETPGISDAALARVPGEIVQAQTTGIDTVSGATLTTNGIKAAVAAAIKAGGGDPAAFAAAVVSKKTAHKVIKESADIVVVGAGGAGISAAVKAETLGKSVILIEKMPTIGGATVLNAGTLIATGSRYQREVMKETKDSPELAYKDIFRVGKNRNDPVLVKMVTEKVGGVVDWLIYDMKIPYGPAATQYPDHSANRQLGVQGRSVNFLNLMKGKFLDMGGKLMLETRAQSFIEKDGKVVGVKAVDAAGNTVELTSKAVILASGGYGADQSLLPPKMKSFLFYGVDGETGDGLKMGEAIGAATINMDLVKQYPQGVETRPHHGLAATASSTDTMKKSGAIYVNRDGKRFVDENVGLGVLTDKTIEQPGSIAYIVMDEAAWKQYVAKSLEDNLVPSAESLNEWTKIVNNGHPVMAVSKSLEDAAKQMGIDPKGLEATVKHWNDMVKAGSDKDFSRRLTGGLAEGGTWRIVEQKVRYQTTLGGLKADGAMRILKKDGSAIPGLYGAGCVVGGANGADSMTAMMNSWAIVSGVVAAESAASYAK